MDVSELHFRWHELELLRLGFLKSWKLVIKDEYFCNTVICQQAKFRS